MDTMQKEPWFVFVFMVWRKGRWWDYGVP